MNLAPCFGFIWRWIHGTLAFETDPVSAPYQASNIISGVTRPERGTNMWISDPAAGLPQAITMRWSDTVEIGTIEVTFDSHLSGWVWEGPFATVARDYAIDAIATGGTRRRLVEVRGNHQRRRVHAVDGHQVQKLILTVTRTNGAATARIVEVRAYPPEERSPRP